MSSNSGYHVLVDGYNAIKRSQSLARLPLEAAREGLLARLSRAAWPFVASAITVVFDAKNSEGTLSHKTQGIRVRFVHDADAEIQREIRDSKNSRAIALISEDAELRATAKAHGSLILSTDILFAAKKNPPANKRSAEADKITPSQARRINEELERQWLGGND